MLVVLLSGAHPAFQQDRPFFTAFQRLLPDDRPHRKNHQNFASGDDLQYHLLLHGRMPSYRDSSANCCRSVHRVRKKFNQTYSSYSHDYPGQIP